MMSDFNTKVLATVRKKCASDELARALYRMLQDRFHNSWESIIRDLADGEIKTDEQITQLFYDNWM